MERNREIYLLAGLTVICLVSGYVMSAFPYLIMLALAPLFRVHELLVRDKWPFQRYFAFILLPLVIAYVFISAFSLSRPDPFLNIVFGALMSVSFYLFWFTDRYSKNRLGYFTLILFWLSMEYAAANLMQGLAEISIGSTLLQLDTIENMSTVTGVTGISAWILFANVLLYYALLRGNGLMQGNFRPLTLIYSLVLIAIPAILSWQFFAELPAEADRSATYTNLVFGRTAAWVSILIVMYSIVQRKVNKS